MKRLILSLIVLAPIAMFGQTKLDSISNFRADSSFSDTVLIGKQFGKDTVQNTPEVFTVNVALDDKADVKVKLFDLVGNEVYSQNAGTHGKGHMNWVVSTTELNLTPNMYFLKVEVDKQVHSRRVLLGY